MTGPPGADGVTAPPGAGAADEVPFDLDRPDRFAAAVWRRRYRREMRSPAALALYALAFLGGAVAATALLDASAGVAAAVGVFGLVAGGQPLASGLASTRAEAHARERLRAALLERWAADAEAVAAWGRGHGLAPVADAGLSAPLDTTPLLLEGEQVDYASVLRGPLGGGTATFFHLTQLGGFPGRGERDAGPAFRWLTCLHMKRRRRDLVMTLHPRSPATPPCGLNRVSLSAIGDAWRAPGGEGERPGSAEQDPRAAASLARLVEAGILPPGTLERMSEWEGASEERRGALAEEMRQEALAWRERSGAPEGFGAMVGLVRALRDEGWREVALESVEFNRRYRLRTKDLDDLEVVGIFDPVLIVAMTEAVPADVFVEIHYENLLVAVPGRIVEPSLLDALLRAAERLGEQVDEAPAPL